MIDKYDTAKKGLHTQNMFFPYHQWNITSFWVTVILKCKIWINYTFKSRPILVVLIMGYLELWCRTISELIAMCNAKSIHGKMLKKSARDQTLEYFSLLFTRISW